MTYRWNLSPADISALLKGDGEYNIKFKEIYIPVRYKRGNSKNIVFLFHGAINRTLRPTPFFQSFIPNLADAHQISIADPSLFRHDDVACCWYAGHEELPLQKLLPEFFSELSSLLGCERKVYVGGSAGGFAALFYSHADPLSIAVVANPQTNLELYKSSGVNNYMRSCWPSIARSPAFHKHINSDLGQLYSEKMENLVIYVQSTGDRNHFYTQFLPFLEAIKEKKPERFISEVGFWGKLGHSNSAPPTAYYPWVQAVLTAPTLLTDDILMARHTIVNKEQG